MIYTIRCELQNKSSGGLRGGISTVWYLFQVAFKPVATIMQKKTRVLDNQGILQKWQEKGAMIHVVPRAVPIIEAMAAIVLADFYLINVKHIMNCTQLWYF
jgi:chorismate synthase